MGDNIKAPSHYVDGQTNVKDKENKMKYFIKHLREFDIPLFILQLKRTFGFL